MGRQLQGILYYLVMNVRHAFTIFWIILSVFFLLTLVIHFMLGVEGATIHFNFSFPIYIFATAIGFFIVKNTLPYLIKMGATRKLIFLGVVIYFIGFALVNSLIANVLAFLLRIITKSEVGGIFVYTDGELSTQFNHIADFLEKDNFLYQVIVDTSLLFFFIVAFFIIGLLFYRYGLLGGFTFVGIIIFTIIFGIANGWLVDFFIDIFSDFSIVFFYQLSLVGFGIYLLSFLLLRRFTI